MLLGGAAITSSFPTPFGTSVCGRMISRKDLDLDLQVARLRLRLVEKMAVSFSGFSVTGMVWNGIM